MRGRGVDWPQVAILAYAFGIPLIAIIISTFVWPK